jgi:hypothetical protein
MPLSRPFARRQRLPSLLRARAVIFGLPASALWAIAAAALAIGEVLTPGLFFLGPLAVAALSAAIVAVLVHSRSAPVRRSRVSWLRLPGLWC